MSLHFWLPRRLSVACSIDVRGNEASTREEKRFTVSATEPVDLKIQTFDGAIDSSVVGQERGAR